MSITQVVRFGTDSQRVRLCRGVQWSADEDKQGQHPNNDAPSWCVVRHPCSYLAKVEQLGGRRLELLFRGKARYSCSEADNPLAVSSKA